jgi:hypothetical protein
MNNIDAHRTGEDDAVHASTDDQRDGEDEAVQPSRDDSEMNDIDVYHDDEDDTIHASTDDTESGDIAIKPGVDAEDEDNISKSDGETKDYQLDEEESWTDTIKRKSRPPPKLTYYKLGGYPMSVGSETGVAASPSNSGSEPIAYAVAPIEQTMNRASEHLTRRQPEVREGVGWIAWLCRNPTGL